MALSSSEDNKKKKIVKGMRKRRTCSADFILRDTEAIFTFPEIAL